MYRYCLPLIWFASSNPVIINTFWITPKILIFFSVMIRLCGKHTRNKCDCSQLKVESDLNRITKIDCLKWIEFEKFPLSHLESFSPSFSVYPPNEIIYQIQETETFKFFNAWKQFHISDLLESCRSFGFPFKKLIVYSNV